MPPNMLARAGIIGDVHGQRAALAAALDFFRAAPDLDVLLCTGDVLGGDGSADACCRLLEEAGVFTVRGNHERWRFETEPFHAELMKLADPEDLRDWPERLSREAHDWLASLPATREFDTPTGRLLLCHGLGADDMAGVGPFDSDAELAENGTLQALVAAASVRFVVNGHTHRRMVRRIGPLTFVNAGTLLPPEPTISVADFGAMRVDFYTVGGDGMVRATGAFGL